MEASCSRSLISGQSVISNAGQKPHESYIMVQCLEIVNDSIQFILQFSGIVCIQGIIGSLIHFPENTGPEAICPPIREVIIIWIDEFSVFCSIREK